MLHVRHIAENGSEEFELFLNPKHIEALTKRKDGGTDIFTVTGNVYSVLEPIELILSVLKNQFSEQQQQQKSLLRDYTK